GYRVRLDLLPSVSKRSSKNEGRVSEWSIITGQPFESHVKTLAGKLYSLAIGFFTRSSSASASDPGGSAPVAGPNELRFFLSHSPRCRTSLKLIGWRTQEWRMLPAPLRPS